MISGHSTTSRHRLRNGLTLLELMMVIAILAVVAGFIIPTAAFLRKKGQDTAARASLVTIRDAIMGTGDKPGYFNDTGQLPVTLRDLFVQPAGMASWNRDTALGWRGPYLLNATGQYRIGNSTSTTFLSGTYPNPYGYSNGVIGDPIILDPWGNAIILQVPNQTASPTPLTAAAANLQFARLISAGPNGVIDTPINNTFLNPTTGLLDPYAPPSIRGDDLVLYLNHSDSDP